MRAIHLRRHAEIEGKLQSLQAELDHWTKLTNETPHLKRYHSQIRVLSATLTGLLEPIRTALAGRPIDTNVLARGVEWENGILAAHSIWEVFRNKYTLRHSELLRDYLMACDDLAWACYEPALRAFAPGLSKPPPLVYLSSTWSPFAQPRDSSFHNEVRVSGEGRIQLRGELFQEVLKRLPFPLVSLPWYQAYHLPGAVIIGHEIGHVVEWDFALHDSITDALNRAELRFTDIWLEWASEIFADLYGCLAMGPAFAGALIDLLTTSPSIVAGEKRRDGRYPTRSLRVDIVLDALAKIGYRADSERLRASWNATYAPNAEMEDLRGEVGKVVDAILQGPHHGETLSGVIRLTPDAQVANIAISAGEGIVGDLKAYSDPRQLMAAAQILHERDPPYRDEAKAFALLVKQTLIKGQNQYRNDGKILETKAALDEALVAQEEAAREQGRQLHNLLLAADRPTPDTGG